ncbi:F-box protein interaction domain protein [Senna tora]|uniref:F-box protein interaction domain protein n=1 Tax=Senna tora TaxID=362788 RepID=A0A834TZJ1_9FABA|nr:F-box protein interaction domain protein [Senna tora]
MAFQYYKTVYDNESNMAMQDILNKIQHLNIPALNERQSQRLLEPISMSEVEDAIFNIKAFKSPGPDRFPAAFFHKHWEKCVSTVEYTLLLNGQKVGRIRGLRQGDPLFPFYLSLLLIFCWIAMKRKRDSIATEVDDPEIQPLSPSFVDLPSPITTNILLRLPIKSVLICKCVCKSWHTIISDPHFAKLHFKDAPADVMIRTNDPKRVSRTLHLLKFQPKQFIGRSNYDNGSRFCICDDFCKPNCKHHIKFEANSSFLCGAKMVLDKMLEAKNGGRKRNPLVVCIPVTGEFIRLPEGSKILRKAIDCGFGYHEKLENIRLEFPTSLNGALHWLSPINYGYEELVVRGTEFKFEAFAHIPSLISLKDDVKGDVEVQNVHSRCSAFKLREENDVLFLAEENVQQGRLYSSSEDDD